MHVDVEQAGQAPERSSLPIILLCGVISIIDGFDTQAIGFAAVHIVEEWNLPGGMAGTFFSAGFVGAIIGALIAGFFYRLLGQRGTLTFWLGCIALASLANALATNHLALIAIRLAGGVGLGAIIPILISTVTQAASSKAKGRAIALIVAGSPIGGVLAGSVYGTISIDLGWRSIFIIGGILPLLMVPLVLVMIPRAETVDATAVDPSAPDDATGPDRSALRETLHTIAGLFQGGRALATTAIMLTAFCGTMLGISLMSWTPMLLNGLSLSEEMSAAGGVALNVGALLSIFGFGYLLDRTGSGWVVSIGFMTGFVLLLFSGIVPLGADARLVVLVLIGFFAIGPNSGVWYLVAASYSGHEVVDATSIGLVVARIGGALGPVLVGFLVSQQIGTNGVFSFLSLIGALAAIGGAIFLLLTRQKRGVPSAA